MFYCCLVCGYPSLPGPPANYEICPCCGTEWGNDDQVYGIPALRARWVEGGALWWSQRIPPPPHWDGHEQLRRAGLALGAAPSEAQLAEVLAALIKERQSANYIAIIGLLVQRVLDVEEALAQAHRALDAVCGRGRGRDGRS